METERPIIFKAAMVRAILDGRKTQTRRLVESRTIYPHGAFWDHPGYEPIEIRYTEWAFRHKNQKAVLTAATGSPVFRCRYGTSGDRLWVRETFALHDDLKPPIGYYRADDANNYESDGNWKPPIFMPRKFSRITLEITKVRVERLKEISQEDAMAEGCQPPSRGAYFDLWDSINGAGAWDKNPWVWVLEFKRIA